MLLAPGVLYRTLRLRGMAPAVLPDPSMHTTFILDPQAIFTRYSAMFTPTSRLREGARVGFLVPARLSYLLFGATPGFFAFRYVLALAATVPIYLLLRKLYGRWAGFAGIAVVMSSPVLVTAWGTDYPDSAAVSYLTGALAIMALSLMSGTARARRGLLITAALLLTLAIFSHGVSVPLVVVMVLVYTIIRTWRQRPGLTGDLALMLSCGAIVTLVLALLSKLLLGQFNFISATLRSESYLSQPSQEILNHSLSNAWAPYDNYLLVPPAVLLAFIAVFARRLRALPAALMFVAVVGALQLAAFAYLQFLGGLQTLEMHYFSSTLWSSVTVLGALTIAQMTAPIVALGQRRHGAAQVLIAAAIPALIVLAIPLAYEIIDSVPIMTWSTGGLAFAGAVVIVAVLHRLGEATSANSKLSATNGPGTPGSGGSAASASALRASARALLAACTTALLISGVLILTVARPPAHAALPNTVFDPYPAFSTALGGSETPSVDIYDVDAQLPAFVGNPTYRGEILLHWEPFPQLGELRGPMGIYHNAFTWVSTTFPKPGKAGLKQIRRWHAAQILLMSLTGTQGFDAAVASLQRFDPVVIKRTVLSHGTYRLHVWLVDLRGNMRSSAPRS